MNDTDDDLTTSPHIEGHEALSMPFLYRVTLYSKNASLDIQGLLRTSYTLRLPLPGGGARLVNGLITRAERGESTLRSTRYTLELRPWLWLLRQQRGCRLFQQASVPDIIQSLCTDAGFPHVRLNLSATYLPQEYIAQYNEDSFHFFSRLLAEAGIFYYFTHSEEAHTLVLADATDPLPACPSLCHLSGPLPATPSAHMQPVSLAMQAQPQACAVDDYNYLTPTVSLKACTQEQPLCVGDFGTGHAIQQDGENLAGIRQDAFDARQIILHGLSASAGLYAGGKVQITGCPQQDINQEWCITHVKTHITANGEQRIAFTALPSRVRYRPSNTFARPRLHGPLSGVVTGKEGEEIWTDKHGRVKVRLHWDAVSPDDENASCWMRVAQSWAGPGYGSFVLPRVGQEVLIHCLDGDPNRPLVTGALYNAVNTPPWPLPDKARCSGIKGKSAPKGQGAGNELCLDDSTDEERLYFHAQKLLDCLVQHERRTRIVGEGGDSLTLEQGDLKVTLEKGKADYTVKGDYNLTVDGNFTLMVKGNITIASNEESLSLTAQKNATLTAKEGDLSHKTGKNLNLDAKGALKHSSGSGLQSTTKSKHDLKADSLLQLGAPLIKIG